MTKGGGKGNRNNSRNRRPAYNNGSYSQRLSSYEMKIFKEFARERQREKEKEEKRKAKLDARKQANKMLSKFAERNDLTYRDGEVSSTDSDSDDGSSSTDSDESEKKKKKARARRKKLKEKKLAKRKAQEDRIRELEEENQKLKKKQASKQRTSKLEEQDQSEGNKTDTSIVTTANQLKKSVAKQMQDGKLPAGFKLPYPPGAKLEFAPPQDLEQAIDTMVKAAVKKAKKAAPSVIMYDPEALKKALESNTPIQAETGQETNSRESRRVSARARNTRRQVTIDDEDEGEDEEDEDEVEGQAQKEMEKQLSKKSKGRIEGRDDKTSTLQYDLKKVIGNANKTLENLQTDAKLKMEHSKISTAHFKQEFREAVEPQVDTLTEGVLRRSKPQVQQAIKHLKLDKYLNKGKGTLREMLNIMLCAIRALPSSK